MEIKSNDYEEQLKSFVANNESTVPAGYIPIELSTKGKVYAPALFHMRNFTTEELMELAFVDEENLQLKVVNMLDALVYEENIHIGDFHEDEVIETLVIFFKSFYSNMLKDQPYELDESDYKYLADHNGGEDSADYKKIISDLKSKRWEPKFSVDLNSIPTYEISDDFKKVAVIKKPTGFTCKYSMPKYGDVVTLKSFVDKTFKEQDRQFESISRTVKFRQDAEQKFLDGDTNINIQALPNVPKAEYEKFVEYQKDKTILVLTAARAQHLEEINGVDLSDAPIEEKFKLAKNPELDYSTFKLISDKFNSTKIGLAKEIKILDPVTNQYRMYPYSFRFNDLLQAIQHAEPDGITIDFE